VVKRKGGGRGKRKRECHPTFLLLREGIALLGLPKGRPKGRKKDFKCLHVVEKGKEEEDVLFPLSQEERRRIARFRAKGKKRKSEEDREERRPLIRWEKGKKERTCFLLENQKRGGKSLSDLKEKREKERRKSTLFLLPFQGRSSASQRREKEKGDR